MDDLRLDTSRVVRAPRGNTFFSLMSIETGSAFSTGVLR